MVVNAVDCNPVSGADLNPSSSSSHILILSSNCTFDTIVVLVVIFITYATLKITELNWTSSECCLCLLTVSAQMGRRIGCCRAGTEETSSTLQWQVITWKWHCQFAGNLHRHSNVCSSSTEGRAHKASEHSDTCAIIALDLGGRCRLQVYIYGIINFDSLQSSYNITIAWNTWV